MFATRQDVIITFVHVTRTSHPPLQVTIKITSELEQVTRSASITTRHQNTTRVGVATPQDCSKPTRLLNPAKQPADQNAACQPRRHASL